MIPMFRLDGQPQCPFGMNMSQNRLAIATWSYAMEMYPPKQIVELGTGNGAFTTCIGVHAWMIKTEIHTFERAVSPDSRWAALSNFLGIKFYTGDLFSMEAFIISLIKRPGVTYLWCDDGDKPREFNLFADHLKPGDVIASHDYCCMRDKIGENHWPWSEIKPEQVEGAVARNNLQPFMQEHFDYAGWLAFKKP